MRTTNSVFGIAAALTRTVAAAIRGMFTHQSFTLQERKEKVMKRSNRFVMSGPSGKSLLTDIAVVLCTLALVVFLVPVFANAATYYVSHGGNDTSGDGSESTPWRTIQHAIDEASGGDIIKVMDDDNEATDDYTENVTVNKSLTIERYNDMGPNPQVKASSSSSDAFYVSANNVTIKGLDIYGATETANGIALHGRSGCTIQDNRCGWDEDHENYCGILLFGSSDNTVSGNTCSSNDRYGISLSSSSNSNTVSGNTCSNNSWGVLMGTSSDNTVSDNTCNLNDYDGIYLFSSSDNTVSGNACNSNSGSGISLSSSSNSNTVSGNACSNSWDGIYLFSSSNNTASEGVLKVRFQLKSRVF